MGGVESPGRSPAVLAPVYAGQRVTIGGRAEPGATSGWEMVNLGVTVPRSYFCICCLTFQGTGMHRDGITYCLQCWETRQQGDPCAHKSSMGDLGQQAAS
jgi:hypothetical protein